jgi:hypothetical protein
MPRGRPRGAPRRRQTMAVNATLANQKKILANQAAITANQKKILANQLAIKANQRTILANQKKILGR